MSTVKKVYCLRKTHPDWLDDLVGAIEDVPDTIFFDQDGKPLKVEVKEFDKKICNELSRRFGGSGKVECKLRLWKPDRQFEIDVVLPTMPGTLVEIEKGQLPRLELDIIKIVSAILQRPDEYAYGCLVVPVNYIELKLEPGQRLYQYVTEHLLPLANRLLDIPDLREFCVVGYLDPRGGEDITEESFSLLAETSQKPRTPYSEPIICESKRYEGKSFIYWWDITPSKRSRLDRVGRITFKKKDSGEESVVESQTLLPLLSQERQTSRKNHPWGIRVLVDHPNELASEPGSRGHGDWSYIPVEWSREKYG